MKTSSLSNSFQEKTNIFFPVSENAAELSAQQKNLLIQEFKKLIATLSENQEKRLSCKFFLNSYEEEPTIQLDLRYYHRSWYLWETDSFLEKETLNIPFQIKESLCDTQRPFQPIEKTCGIPSRTLLCGSKGEMLSPQEEESFPWLKKTKVQRFQIILTGPQSMKQEKSHLNHFYAQLLYIMDELRTILIEHEKND